MLVFADEVFDSLPDPSDTTHVKIGDTIFKLFCELEKQDYTFYEQIAAKYQELKAQKVQFIDGKFSEGADSHDDEDGSDNFDPYPDDEKMDEPSKKPKEDISKKSATQTSEEFEKFRQEEEEARQKKKAKKNQGFGGTQISEAEQQKIDEEIKQLAAIKDHALAEDEQSNPADEDDWETA